MAATSRRAASPHRPHRVSLDFDKALYGYLLRLGLRESAGARALRFKTLAAAPPRRHILQISPEQGAFLALLVRLIGARRTLDVGTFTGYSALVVAEALPADGKVIACDISAEYAAIARPMWESAGVAGKIDLRLAPAVETLDALLASGGASSFDFAFVDADKESCDAYYERSLELLRPGGLIAIDDVLWFGAVADDAVDDEPTRAIRALNAKVHGDARVDMALLPIGDGLTLAVKRA